MKYTFPLLLVILFANTLLLNCTCKHPCTGSVPVLKFVNFDSASLHAVVVKQYNNNGQFTALQSTRVYTNLPFTSSYMPGPDTSQFDVNGISLEFFNDYIIEVPAAGKTWYLKSLSATPAKMSEPHCTNGIKYYLNDTLFTIPPNTSTSYNPMVIYLSR